MSDDAGAAIETPDDLEEDLTQQYTDELESRRPSAAERAELRSRHRHHLVRETTSQYSETDEPTEGMQIEKTAHVPDMFCFTCNEWVGLSGVDLRGKPRSRKDAYYLNGPPEEVDEARQHVRDSLADLVQSVAATVPRIEDAHEALDFIEGEHEKARERLTEANDAE